MPSSILPSLPPSADDVSTKLGGTYPENASTVIWSAPIALTSVRPQATTQGSNNTSFMPGRAATYPVA